MNRRSLKAYSIAFRVLLGYLKLYLLSKIFGKRYWNKHIKSRHKKSALRIKKGLLELKGLLIKVGQLISILSNVLPIEFREPLESLQDQLPAQPFEDIEETIEQAFGKPIDELFYKFEKKPLATASIGQTHRAVIENGLEVVVKVQHKDIERIAKSDLEVINNLVKFSAFFFDFKGMEYMYSQIKLMIEEELDYVHEASVMQKIKGNILSRKGWIVPEVHLSYSSSKVITSTFYEGVKICDIEQLDKWGINRDELADKFLLDFVSMIFEDSIFHADPHPGNILVNKDGEIILLDFGAVTTLSPEIKNALPSLIIAFTRNDATGLVKALKDMGFVGSGSEAQALAEKLIKIGQDFLKDEIKIESFNLDGLTIDPDSKIISKLFAAINLKEIANTFQIPKDWILLQRILILVMGVSNQLAPTQNPIDVLRPYFRKKTIGNVKSMATFVSDTVKKSLLTMMSIPPLVEKTLNQVQKDGLKLDLRDQINSQNKLAHIFQQLIFVLMIGMSIYFGQMFKEEELIYKISKGILLFSSLGFVIYFWKSLRK